MIFIFSIFYYLFFFSRFGKSIWHLMQEGVALRWWFYTCSAERNHPVPNFLETHTIFSVMRTDFTAATFLAHALNGYFVIYDVCMLALGCGMALPWRSKYLLKLPQLLTHHPVSRAFSSSYSSSRVDICFMPTDTFFSPDFFSHWH